ncbi:MAG: trypsin-like peptidase domain-containing protein [Victivallaceae bacterium]|nr:trypsin-like peptidase domain-containing protein [Victivallaceae bacterium]
MKKLLAITIMSALAGGLAADENRENRITPVVLCINKVMPSVVNLSAERLMPAGSDDELPFATAHEPAMNKTEYSLGSGCVVDPNGLVLTNAHVIFRAAKVLVTLSNGGRYWADVIASDNYNDLALLRINGLISPLKPVPMAEPGDLILGEPVIIVGNPYGLGGTIVEGILSAINRRISVNDVVVFDDLLQTDASVHPGNSGAPLLNINGEMIGMSLANLQDAPGISFALPQQRISDALGMWLIPERFRDVSLGLIPAVRREESGELVFYIREVLPDSPAARAGLRAGMTISHLNGKLLEHDITCISGALWKIAAGDTITLVSNSDTYTITAEPLKNQDWRQLAKLKLGLSLLKLTPEMAEALNYPDMDALVVSSPPANAGVGRGDILIQLGDAAINTPDDLARVLNNVRYGKEMRAVFFEYIPGTRPAQFKRKTVVLSVNKKP